MRLNWNGLIAAIGLLACIAVIAFHWYEHPREMCFARFGGRAGVLDPRPRHPCPP
jgi:hypothetical protein